MGAFRYQAVESSGAAVAGVIEAEDRRSALKALSGRGLFPSAIEACEGKSSETATAKGETKGGAVTFAERVRSKDVTAFTRKLSALLDASIPIPQALAGLADQEDAPGLKAMLTRLEESVRKGASLSAAMEEHPRVFSRLYISMVRVGEEAGALPTVMNDLAALLEHDDEVRSEVVSAVAYPAFVLCFGIVTVAVLLTFVLPRLFGMLTEMMDILPLPTLILLRISSGLKTWWPLLLILTVLLAGGWIWFSRTPRGALLFDRIKLKLPLLGPVFMASALSRFARTLGTLVKSGVSLLPSLKIVENTIGNLVLGGYIAQVTEETRGGDSLAGPLRKLNVFPKTVVQMIDVGEESGKLDEMLLKVAEIQEKEMRARTKTLVSLLAPILILVVGAIVGFIVIALLLPIFKMSRAMR